MTAGGTDRERRADAAELRARILELVGEYHAAAFPRQALSCPGETPLPVSGKVFDADEMQHLVEASLDFWLTTGRFAGAVRAASSPRWIGRPPRRPRQLGLVARTCSR